MERLSKSNVNLFDKTGTLIKGKPEVTFIQPNGISEKELFIIGGEPETVSEYHLGPSIVKNAEEMNLRFKNRPTEVEGGIDTFIFISLLVVSFKILASVTFLQWFRNAWLI